MVEDFIGLFEAELVSLSIGFFIYSRVKFLVEGFLGLFEAKLISLSIVSSFLVGLNSRLRVF